MKNILEGALSRRNLIATAGVAGASLALPGLASAKVGKPLLVNDSDILNFALNLEYLEAEFYSYAVYGHGIESSLFGGVGDVGATTGGKKINFGSSTLTAVATEIAADELAHVKLLRSALGGAAVAKPAINLNALGIGFGSPTEFLTLSRAFEDTGVSAYGGAASLISDPNILQVAAQILAVEAYHAGNIRYQLAKPQPGFATDAKDQPPTTSNYIPTDANALAIIRTTTEVLSIVYGGSTTPGGFFPNGLNGSIR